MIEIDTVRFYLLSLKVKPRLVIRLLISLFRQFDLFFLVKWLMVYAQYLQKVPSYETPFFSCGERFPFFFSILVMMLQFYL